MNTLDQATYHIGLENVVHYNGAGKHGRQRHDRDLAVGANRVHESSVLARRITTCGAGGGWICRTRSGTLIHHRTRRSVGEWPSGSAGFACQESIESVI